LRRATVMQYICAYQDGVSMNYNNFVGKSLSILETCQMIACLTDETKPTT